MYIVGLPALKSDSLLRRTESDSLLRMHPVFQYIFLLADIRGGATGGGLTGAYYLGRPLMFDDAYRPTIQHQA